MPRAAVPDDKVNLRLILVSGKTKDFLFRPNESAGEIAQYVFDNWPVGEENWKHEKIIFAKQILSRSYFFAGWVRTGCLEFIFVHL